MRRKDREVTDPAMIREIIRTCSCCRLGFADQGEVYIVPLNYGWEETDGTYRFYFHGALEGRKHDLILKRPRVGFELDGGCRIYGEADVACTYTSAFQSIIGTGTVEPVEDLAEKRKGMLLVMEQATGRKNWEIPDAALRGVFIFRLTVEKLSGKIHE